MSYLEMPSAPLPDMDSGIISIWFREVTKQQKEGPPAEVWPQGFWTEATAGETMVPPNAQYSLQYDPDFENTMFYFNPYGTPSGGLIFGDAFLGPAAVWIPNSPPLPLNTMSGDATGVADTDMSKFGIRALLTFGDPHMDYRYCTWRREDPSVIEAVKYLPSVGIAGEGGLVPDWPLPYKPYIKIEGGVPIGNNGKFKVANYRLDSSTPRGRVPPSFIGIDDDGHLVINLQTNARATYRGMAFELSDVAALTADATYLEIIGPPYTYSQIGFPFPDGVWHMIKGFWNGYEFKYNDISQEVMGCAPESFLIYASTQLLNFAFGAPTVTDDKWHHLLFSFDIRGSVTTNLTDDASPVINTGCRAWMAFDDVDIKGTDLQNRPPLHDGLLLPKLRGTETTQILDCGPSATYSRASAKLVGDNDILPRNAWLHGFQGNPKDGGLPQHAAQADVITNGADVTNATARMWGGKVGNFNWMNWTGSIWPLYGHGIAPGPWQATFSPMGPTTPDHTTLDAPSYSCSEFKIPVNGHPIGVPAGAVLNEYNTGVEMAELQIWANRTLDTSDVDLRRLFIDKNGKPVPPKVAAARLGKPDILLHGSSSWKTGRNSGTSGFLPSGKINPAGQFRPVAVIRTFEPPPRLGV